MWTKEVRCDLWKRAGEHGECLNKKMQSPCRGYSENPFPRSFCPVQYHQGILIWEEQTEPLKNFKSLLLLQYLVPPARKQRLSSLLGESLRAILELTGPSDSPGAAEGNRAAQTLPCAPAASCFLSRESSSSELLAAPPWPAWMHERREVPRPCSRQTLSPSPMGLRGTS